MSGVNKGSIRKGKETKSMSEQTVLEANGLVKVYGEFRLGP
ncbi:MAG: hypothetical protein K0Q90_1169, partial [Paenibacillaceae bacterium]|nr:hypothetical protein [Paenibacillaceae bacterium]